MANKVLPELILKDIQDPWVRENFFRLQKFLKKFPLFRGEFEFREFTFTQAGTNLKVPHALGFAPTDILQTSLVGAGTLTWNYASFDNKNLDVTVTGPCTVRAFVGAYREEQ